MPVLLRIATGACIGRRTVTKKYSDDRSDDGGVVFWLSNGIRCFGTINASPPPLTERATDILRIVVKYYSNVLQQGSSSGKIDPLQDFFAWANPPPKTLCNTIECHQS